MKEQHRYCWTQAQYLAFERDADSKHEYRDGEVVAVPLASTNHVRIMGSAGARLHHQVRGTEFEVMCAQMRVKVPDGSFYGYPDVLVTRDADCEGQDDILTNPIVIFEILSHETEAFDRSEKFHRYQQIPTLRDYILISQNCIKAEHFARENNGEWRLIAIKTGEDDVILDSIGCRLKLSEIYERVQFDSTEDDETE